jgi:hypothetical protein
MTTYTVYQCQHVAEDANPIEKAIGTISGGTSEELRSRMLEVIEPHSGGLPLTKTDDFEYSDGFNFFYQIYAV